MTGWDAESSSGRDELDLVGGFPAGDLVRALRRSMDLSQRELATRATMPRSTIERIEAGACDPKVGQLACLLSLAGWRLAVVDARRREIAALRELGGDLRDGADRRYPAHLDVIIEPRRGEWWGDQYGLQSPPETFTLDRERRDTRRARSQWDLQRGPYRRRSNGPRP